MAETETSFRKPVAWSLAKAIDQGRRDYQEDAIGTWNTADASVLLVVVADGAGGHGGGAEASRAAVDEAERRMGGLSKSDDAERFLESWMLGAHAAVNEGGAAAGRTAAVAMLACGDRVEWVHAGDCRLYHFRNGERLHRTRDDSVVQVLFEQGEITEAEMGTHEDQNRLLQAIGGEDPPKPRKGGAEAQPGDVFLLCSDGFWENLDPEDLDGLAAVPAAKRQKALLRAVRLAVKQGGAKADNTSAVLAAYGEGGGGMADSGKGLSTGGRLRFLLYCVALAMVVLALWFVRPMLMRWVETRSGGQSEVGESVPAAPTTEPAAPTTEPAAPTTEPAAPTTEPAAPATPDLNPNPNPNPNPEQQ